MNPKLVDIHAHLNFPDFDSDRDEVIRRALDEGIGIIDVGCDLKNFKKAVAIAEKYEGVFACVGLHPDEEIEKLPNDLKELARNPKVVAIGECGIDLKSQKSNLKSQKDLFIKQIELAKELDKPLMIHCRQAHKEVIEILKESKHYGNIHFFSGTWQEAEQYFDLGFTISFTGVITFARNYDEVIKKSPLDKIMIETDAPFVSPAPFRGKRNEPLYVKEVAKKIAEIKNLDYEEVARVTTENALRFFKLA